MVRFTFHSFSSRLHTKIQKIYKEIVIKQSFIFSYNIMCVLKDIVFCIFVLFDTFIFKHHSEYNNVVISKGYYHQSLTF